MGRRLVLIALAGMAGLLAAGYGARYYWMHRYDNVILAVAPVYGLDPRLVRTVIRHESFFDERAASGAGAVGLMQVTAPVYFEWHSSGGERALTTSQRGVLAAAAGSADVALQDPEVNLHVGCWYLARLLKRFDGEPEPLVIALAAYNAGSANAERWLAKCAHLRGAERTSAFIRAIDYPETSRYVTSIRRDYAGPGGRG